MSEIELLQKLLEEVREIRKNLDTLKLYIEDIKDRLASIETSRIRYLEEGKRRTKYPKETRYV